MRCFPFFIFKDIISIIIIAAYFTQVYLYDKILEMEHWKLNILIVVAKLSEVVPICTYNDRI